MKNIITIPNFISFIRLGGGILFVPLKSLYHFSDSTVFMILIGAWITDLLDGWSARKLNQISDSGKYIDPIADKVFIVAVITTLYFEARVSLFYLILVVARDVLILVGGAYIKSVTGMVLPSNLFGKLCVVAIGFYFFSVILSIPPAEMALKWISIFFIFGSLLIYFQRAKELVRDIRYVQQN